MDSMTQILQDSLNTVFLPTFLKIVLPVVGMILLLSIIKMILRPITRKSKLLYALTEIVLFLTLGIFTARVVPQIIYNLPLPETPQLNDSGNDPFSVPETIDTENPFTIPE